MVLEKKPFVPYVLEEDRVKDKGKVFTIRLNQEELLNLKDAQKILQQEKDSTAVKQLAMFGLYVLHDRSTAYILKVLENNIRKNKRLGIEKVNIKP
jgi:hypothetical protein